MLYNELTLFEFDKKIVLEKNVKYLCGVDEAGRGPLAGPVYAAAVILDPDKPIEGLDDSKKVTPKKRSILFDEIIKSSLAYSIQHVDVSVIEEINILQATMVAMRQSVEELSVVPDYVVFDGNRKPDITIKSESLIKGDSLSASVAAASILAKVSRDRYMIEMAEKYPEYEFERHKGYGTALHRELIKKHGASKIHRMSFLSKILKD